MLSTPQETMVSLESKTPRLQLRLMVLLDQEMGSMVKPNNITQRRMRQDLVSSFLPGNQFGAHMMFYTLIMRTSRLSTAVSQLVFGRWSNNGFSQESH